MPHIHELIDFTVSAYVTNQDRVLLIHHKALDKWLPLGGHIDLDEDPEEALFREVEEESGIRQEDLEVASTKTDLVSPGTKFLYRPFGLNIHQITETHRHVGLVYFLRSKTDEIILAEREHLNIRWFKTDELEDQEYNLAPDVKYYSIQALTTFKFTN